MTWLYYLAEANIYLAVFYLAYYLFLKKETYYQLTRAYLLFACVASFTLPVLQIGALKRVETVVSTTINYAASAATVPDEYIPTVNPLHIISPAVSQAIATPTVTVAPTVTTPKVVVAAAYHLTPQGYLMYAYLIGAGIVFLLLIVKLSALFKLMRNAKWVEKDNYKLVYLPETNAAFSFFNYLFIGANAHSTDTIIRHELVHIRQKHSVDIIFLELLKVVSWFNPFIYLLQKSIKAVHEYIADEQTAAYETDALTYSSFLVNNAYGASGSSITHSFFNYNLLKKRIIMLNKQRSGTLARLKYLVTIPICAILLCASTLAFSKTYALVDLDPAKGSGIKLMANKSAHKKHTNKNVAANDAPITLSGTDNGDIAQADDIPTTPIMDSPKLIIEETRPMIPIESAGGYEQLNLYLLKNIHYKPANGDKGGLVVMSFTVGAGRKITDLRVATSDGEVMDNLALNAFKNYTGIINDDEGKTLKIGVFFFTDDYSIFKRPFENDPGNSGWVTVTKYGFSRPRTSKGYEYTQHFGTRYAEDSRVTRNVRIFEKNDEEKWFNADTATPNELKLLKDKYGYVFPSNSYTAVEIIKAANGKNDIAHGLETSSYLNDPYAGDFFDHINNHLKYPEKEKNEGTAGTVLLKFSLDQNGTISNVDVVKSGGADFDQAALDIIRSFTGTINDNAGQHTIAVVFCTAQNGKRPIVNESWKKTAGYVGEVARGENAPIYAVFPGHRKQ